MGELVTIRFGFLLVKREEKVSSVLQGKEKLAQGFKTNHAKAKPKQILTTVYMLLEVYTNRSTFHTFSKVHQIALGKFPSDRLLLAEEFLEPLDLYDAQKNRSI